MINKNSPNIEKQRAAFFTLLAAGLLLFYFLIDFLIPFLGAIIFYQILKGFMWRLTDKLKWNATISALVIMFCSMFVIVFPLIYLFEILYEKLSLILKDDTSLVNHLKQLNTLLETYFGIDIFSAESINAIKNFVAKLIPNIINKMLNTLMQVALMYFILFYFLINHKTINQYIKDFLPFNDDTFDMYVNELDSMTKSNVIGAPILAACQGLAAIFIFYITKAPDPYFWGIMCGIFSFIPVVGSALVWLPVCLIMYANGFVWQPIAIALYGALVISNIDNLLRMYIQKFFANVHPLVTILGVIFGLQVFGLPGLIFGPLLISYFILGLNIYRKSYGMSSNQNQ